MLTLFFAAEAKIKLFGADAFDPVHTIFQVICCSFILSERVITTE